MTYFPDLSPYTYGRVFDGPMVNVGWLDPPEVFARGPVPDRFVSALRRLAKRPRNRTRGAHVCGYCRGAGAESVVGNGEIHAVGADGVRYSAPVLVLHYVVDHSYLPPAAFVAAVLEKS